MDRIYQDNGRGMGVWVCVYTASAKDGQRFELEAEICRGSEADAKAGAPAVLAMIRKKVDADIAEYEASRNA